MTESEILCANCSMSPYITNQITTTQAPRPRNTIVAVTFGPPHDPPPSPVIVESDNIEIINYAFSFTPHGACTAHATSDMHVRGACVARTLALALSRTPAVRPTADGRHPDALTLPLPLPLP